jgi:uncharacterized membrane protein SirB2
MQSDFIFPTLKLIHMSCALLSIGGFTLRGYWMLTENLLLNHRAAKIFPHIIDTLLLASAIGMLLVWKTSPLELNWLIAKILGLLAYIFLGMIALRFGRTKKEKGIAWLLALLSAAYIVSVAYSKNPLGLFSIFS